VCASHGVSLIVDTKSGNANINCYLQGLEEVKRLSTKVDTLAAALARIEAGMKDTSGGTPKFGASFRGGGANWRRGGSSANVLKA
jgi:hypothetical protein